MTSTKKKLNDQHCRVIKISKEAIQELVYEAVKDSLQEYFDLGDDTEVTSYHRFDPVTNDYLCLVYNNLTLPKYLDLSSLIKVMPITTDSMFNDSRYKELSFEELQNLIKSDKQD